MKHYLFVPVVAVLLALIGMPCFADHTFDEMQVKAEQGYAEAQYNLGVMYHEGQGVPQNDAEAVKWFRKAAEQGDAKAQTNLGVMYDKGQGVPQNDAEAVNWYRKAAEQGHANAQYNLGVMYHEGQGVPKNYVLSYMWLSLAASQGTELAKQAMGILERMMTPSQIAEAQRLAAAWKPVSR